MIKLIIFGADMQSLTLGEGGVISIVELTTVPISYDVGFTDGTTERIYDIKRVTFFPIK